MMVLDFANYSVKIKRKKIEDKLKKTTIKDRKQKKIKEGERR